MADTTADTRDRLVLLMAAQMRHELKANEHKGNKWRDLPLATHEHEVIYHAVKLVLAARDGQLDAVREYAADVANCAGMLADSFGALNLDPDPRADDYDTVGSDELRDLADRLIEQIVAVDAESA